MGTLLILSYRVLPRRPLRAHPLGMLRRWAEQEFLEGLIVAPLPALAIALRLTARPVALRSIPRAIVSGLVLDTIVRRLVLGVVLPGFLLSVIALRRLAGMIPSDRVRPVVHRILARRNRSS